MTLPTGQFWCWRGVEDFVQMGTNEPFVGCSFPNIGSLRKHGFSHTFGDGSVPEPRDALLLDDRVRVRICHDCHEEIGGQFDAPDDPCPACDSKNIEDDYHARIVTRKPLEDKP